jgi:hypothetical protein
MKHRDKVFLPVTLLTKEKCNKYKHSFLILDNSVHTISATACFIISRTPFAYPRVYPSSQCDEYNTELKATSQEDVQIDSTT